MAGGRIQHSFLGEAATRLIRGLAVDGDVSPDFESGARIVPVALVSDLTIPGMGDRRGRRFAGGAIQAGGANAPQLGIIATRDVVITSLQASAQTAGEWSVRVFGPADVPTFAIATLATPFLDRIQSGTEFAPVFSGSDATGAALFGTICWRNTILINTPYTIGITPFCLAAGSGIYFRAAVTATADFNWAGYEF